MPNPNTDQCLKIIEDNLVVIAQIEKRQSELIKKHSQVMAQIDARLDRLAARDETIDARIDKLVSATGALI